MSASELSDVAWDLVDYGRPMMTPAELNTAFVSLGIGEFTDAIEVVMTAMVHTCGPALPGALASRLSALERTYYLGERFAELLSQALGAAG